MSANRIEQALPASPGSSTGAHQATVGAAVQPPAPQVLDAAASGPAASRPAAAPAPDSATLAANLRRMLPAGRSAAAGAVAPATITEHQFFHSFHNG